jgi:hypothetical protein
LEKILIDSFGHFTESWVAELVEAYLTLQNEFDELQPTNTILKMRFGNIDYRFKVEEIVLLLKNKICDVVLSVDRFGKDFCHIRHGNFGKIHLYL